MALNVGVLAVTTLLTDSGAGAGLGLGLFGILSIIRLRSNSITQEEVAYYFVALALGLVAGLHPDPVWLTPALSVLLVGVMYAADHPKFAQRTYRQTVTPRRGHTRTSTRSRSPCPTCSAPKILHVVVQELDMVRDLTDRGRPLPDPAARGTGDRRPARCQLCVTRNDRMAVAG